MNLRSIRFAALACAVTLGSVGVAAQAQPSSSQDEAPRPHAAPSSRLGKIVAIDPIRTRPQGSGVGAVAGGVVGGLLGNKVIGGTAATAIGAVGGAVAGNNLERNHREGVAGYHIHVRMDRGGSSTFDQARVDGLHVGDRVRVNGGRIHPL